MFLTIVTAVSGPVGAQDAPEPARTPFLMIDTEMHVGGITAIATDGEAELVATGSADKSIRLFAASDGRLLRKVVLPLGDALIGGVTGLAMAPDGSRLLAGTVSFDTGSEFDEGSLYLVEPQSGTLLGRIKHLPAAPSQVRYSPDGSRIALGYGQRGFALVTAQGKPLFQDLKTPIAALALADDRLVTISESAEVRVFPTAGDKVGEPSGLTIKAAGQPFSIALSPDGARLAVGYLDRSFVDVITLAGKTKVRLEPPPDLADGNLALVAWTSGAKPMLVAGGTLQSLDLENVLVAWPDGAGDAAVPLPVATDAVTALAPAGADGVVFATADPTWGKAQVEADGALRLLAHRKGERLDFRELPARGFAVARDGGSVLFSDRDPTLPPLRFDLADLALAPDPPPDAGLLEPDQGRVAKLLGAWRYSTTPALQGRRLELGKGERALSADLDAAGERLVLGTDDRLRLYGKTGEELASRRLTAAAWAVALVPDRPVLVAALGDGSVRWYSLREDALLAEIAGLFVAADGERWVAWTGDGLFAHADRGGAALVGYQQNGTTKAPTGTWLPFDQAYRLFYDPEAVRGVLSEPEQWPAIARADRVKALFDGLALPQLSVQAYCPLPAMPPQVATRGLVNVKAKKAAASVDNDGCVELAAAGRVATALRELAVPGDSEAVRVRLSVTVGSRGLAAVDALADGRNAGRVALPTGDGAPLAAGEQVEVERVVPLADAATNLVFRAYDEAGVASQSAPLLIRREGPPPAPPTTLHVLAVGVNAYQGAWPRLNHAATDAQTFADLIEAAPPAAYAKVDVRRVSDAEADRGRLEAELRDLAGRARPNDALLVYLAGHGTADDAGSYTFVTSNATDVAGVDKEGMTGAELVQAIAEIPARNKFLFLDTCYSGAFDMRGPDLLAQEGGFLVLTAASNVQQALDSYDGRNGTLAYVIREKLTDPKLAPGEPIDALQLGMFARKEVQRLAAERNWQQNANFKMVSQDLQEFPIAEVKGPASNGQ